MNFVESHGPTVKSEVVPISGILMQQNNAIMRNGHYFSFISFFVGVNMVSFVPQIKDHVIMINLVCYLNIFFNYYFNSSSYYDICSNALLRKQVARVKSGKDLLVLNRDYSNPIIKIEIHFKRK